MTVWRISWNFIPTFNNLKIKRVVRNSQCPRCGCDEENSYHIFQKCPTSIEVWNQLNLSWLLSQNNDNIWGWLTWVFARGTDEQLRLFCCNLWFIWFSRNQLVYERKNMSGSEIVRKISDYITELAVTKEGKITLLSHEFSQQVSRSGRTIIHFDAAFNSQDFRSASGLIAWNEEGVLLATQAVTHSNVANPFTVEAYAGLHAIKLGIRLGVNRIDIMGDSRTIIKKCKSKNTDKSVIGAIIRDIQTHCNSFQEIEFSFIQKAKNIYAHTIAKEALRRNERFYLEKEVPVMVRRAVGNLWPKPPD
ncbi:uncharacterized protein [Gossypium hirsutum]|uniref:Reverse transcriptase n=1 Tax=Gossypium hirsutum TaxID=3635 RepID=A0ABM3ASU0_GOSHI|nr:uncharacterized protein LOC121222088 [Gossypium hirsutum]